MLHRLALNTAARPRRGFRKKVKRGSKQVASSTSEPDALSAATPNSISAARESGSALGVIRSLPPIRIEVRSAPSSIARGICSSTTLRTLRPRTPRLAYSNSSPRRRALPSRMVASLSAQPNQGSPRPTIGSQNPSVIESPSATYLCQFATLMQPSIPCLGERQAKRRAANVHATFARSTPGLVVIAQSAALTQ